MAGVLVGAPGTLDDLDVWKRVVGDMSPLWQGISIGGGAALVGMWLLAVASSRRVSIREKITPSAIRKELRQWGLAMLLAVSLLLVVASIAMASRIVNAFLDLVGFPF